MKSTEIHRFTAKTVSGMEEVLAEELVSIGAGSVTLLKRAVSFEGDKELMYLANYCCRTALRILQPLKSFKINEQQDLYTQVLEIPWEEFIDPAKTIAVDAVNSTSVFTNSMFIAQRTKDAVADRFRSKGKPRPSVDLENPDIRINVHIYKDDCNLSLDSSGSSLHKRGYRKSAGFAPLNEVLAAGMVKLSGWDPSKTLYDPMCGSGTILIEAAMVANRIPSGYFKKNFGFMNWADYDEKLWLSVKEKKDAEIIRSNSVFYGSDISVRAVQTAKDNLSFTGMDEQIILKKAAFGDFVPEDKPGILIFNPPYDERLKVDNIITFYKEIGDVLKKKFTGYEAWVISSDLRALKFIGLHPSKKIPVFNGPLECRFVRFNLY